MSTNGKLQKETGEVILFAKENNLLFKKCVFSLESVRYIYMDDLVCAKKSVVAAHKNDLLKQIIETTDYLPEA